MVTKQTVAARKRILKAIPRAKLESLVGNDLRPWHWDRATLHEWIIARWDEDIRTEILAIVARSI